MNALTKSFVDLIIYRNWSIDRVPERYRAEVQAELDRINAESDANSTTNQQPAQPEATPENNG